MDPQACFDRLVEALEFSDREEAAEAADDLANWLTRGGATPKLDPDSLAFVLGSLADYLRK